LKEVDAIHLEHIELGPIQQVEKNAFAEQPLSHIELGPNQQETIE
jgi:hypothetical protein